MEEKTERAITANDIAPLLQAAELLLGAVAVSIMLSDRQNRLLAYVKPAFEYLLKGIQELPTKLYVNQHSLPMLWDICVRHNGDLLSWTDEVCRGVA